MAGANGRALTLDWDSVTLVGVRTKGYTITNDYVDVTTDDDDGWRTLLADPGLRAVEVTAEGISSDQVLIAEMMKANITGEPLTIQLPTTTGTLAGTFLVSSFEQTGEHDGAVEFSATFMSTGAVTYTAGT
jgi:TP901-1 family phage major tail protein